MTGGAGWWQSGQMRQTVNLFPYRFTGSNPVHPSDTPPGWMPEWLNGLVLKTRVAQTRGFESRSIREQQVTMRKEHYRRVVQNERRRRYPHRQHKSQRPKVTHVSRMWSTLGRGYRGEDRAAAWAGLAMRTGATPQWVHSKSSVAKRRLMKGDRLGCRATVSGDAAYERLEERRVRGLAERRPFEGIERDQVDAAGQLTFSRGEPNVMPGRKTHYEAFYRVSQDAKKGRYRTVGTNSDRRDVGRQLLRGRRFPVK